MPTLAGAWCRRGRNDGNSLRRAVEAMLGPAASVAISESQHTALGIVTEEYPGFDGFSVVRPGFAALGRLHCVGSSSPIGPRLDDLLRLPPFRRGNWLAQNAWGSYVLAIVDERGELQVFRDPTGLSTVYYRVESDVIFFSSDLASLGRIGAGVPAYDESFLACFAAWGVHTTERTPLRGILELLPGECLTTGKGAIETLRFWTPIDCLERAKVTEPTYEELREVFIATVDRSLTPHRSVYVDLSGGLDSSTLLASLVHRRERGKIIASTVFHPSVASANELLQARSVAASLDVKLIEINGEQYLPFTPTKTQKFVRHKPTPQLLHLALHDAHAMAANAYGCSVFANGYGGDQVFQAQLQQPLHVADHLLEKSFGLYFRELTCWCSLLGLPYLPTVAKSISAALRAEFGKHEAYLGRRRPSGWVGRELLELQSKRQVYPPFWNRLRGVGPLKARQVLDIYDAAAFLDRGDRHSQSTMHHPFFEQPIVEFALALPVSSLARNGEDRYLFRKMAMQMVPLAIGRRRAKGEYSGMYQLGLRKNAKRIEEIVMDGWFVSSSLVDRSKLREQLALASQGFSPDIWSILNLITLELWLNSWKSQI